MKTYIRYSMHYSFILALTVIGIGFFYFSSAYAEDQINKIELEKIVVTGSHIPQLEANGISPVAVIDKEKIERSGATTLNELFKKNIFTAAGVIDEQFTQGAAPASSGIDLRGLGLSRTLILLDGRRMPIFPFGQSKIGAGNSDSFVDINMIPLAAVERIEILKDGASALYGADAVAGVVNIITHKKYEGAQLSGQYGQTTRGDAGEGKINLLSGISSEKTNLTLALDYLNRSDVKAADREISHSANGAIDDRSQVGSPGTIVHRNGSIEPDRRCPASQIKDGICLFDYAPFSTLIPEVERTGLMLSFDHQFSDNFGAFVRGTYHHSYSQRALAPASAPTFNIARTNPNNPFPGESILSVYRLTELGSRVDEFKTDAFNVVTGLTAKINTWDLEFAFAKGQVDTRIKGVSGYAKKADLNTLVANGTLNPFGNSPNFNASTVNYQTQRDGQSQMHSVDFKANGEVLKLPFGALKMALGGDYRKEEFSDKWDSSTTAGKVIGVGGTSGQGGRDIFASYMEFGIPLWKYLDFQVAGRFDHYSDFGTTLNPKGSLRWQPIDSLTLRANAGTGFKAPALHEVYGGDFTGSDSVFDPVTRTLTQVAFTSSGNRNLKAEKTQSWGGGFAWDVIEDLNVSLDYWHISNENAVLSSPQFYVNNEARFPGNVVRDNTGQIVSVFSPFNNVAAQKLWGLDLASSFSWAWDHVGNFRLGGDATYLGSFEQQPAPGEPFKQLAGIDGHPEWRSRGTLVWNKSDYEVSLTTNYVDSYKRPDSNSNIGSWTTFDMQAVWRPIHKKYGSITLGVDNLADQAPPLDPNFEGWPFFNRALHNPRGRFLYAGYKYEF